MLDRLLGELSGRGFGVILGLLAGGLITWSVGQWRRYRQRQSILHGDARDTIVIHQHIIEPAAPKDGVEANGLGVLRVRAVGQAELDRVVPHIRHQLCTAGTEVRAARRRSIIALSGSRRTRMEVPVLREALTNVLGPDDSALSCDEGTIGLVRENSSSKTCEEQRVEHSGQDRENGNGQQYGPRVVTDPTNAVGCRGRFRIRLLLRGFDHTLLRARIRRERTGLREGVS